GSDTAVVAARDFLPRCAIAFFLFFWTFLKRKLGARSFYDCRQSFTPPPHPLWLIMRKFIIYR
ncbi:hypothetical protein KFW05_18985, partial [Klebsiella pneumoniae]|uniref:hypothetical protein n=1 Tax=Klebsiella pneumoniae TaxID=573 RepID=UPI001BAAB681